MALSNKASNFVISTNDYGALSNKATIIGKQTFAELLPYLCSEKIRKDLEVPEPGEITPEIQGSLEFAATINLTCPSWKKFSSFHHQSLLSESSTSTDWNKFNLPYFD